MRLASAAVAATLSLGGCSSSSPQSVPAPLGGVPSAAAPAPVQAASASSAPPLVPSSLYAALFEEGRVFKLRIETTDSRWDDAASKNVTRKIPSTATCRVTERQVRAWGLASQIACEGGPSGTLVYPIGGRWAATPKGLYHLDQVTDLSSGEFPDEALVLAASPVALEQATNDPLAGGVSATFKVLRRNDAWCSERWSLMGDESWTTACYAPGAGPISGTWGWSGGVTRGHVFTVVP